MLKLIEQEFPVQLLLHVSALHVSQTHSAPITAYVVLFFIFLDLVNVALDGALITVEEEIVLRTYRQDISNISQNLNVIEAS